MDSIQFPYPDSSETLVMQMPPFVPPESGDLPEGGKRILKTVYVSLRTKGTSQESAAKQAWAAVKNAGYRKDSSGHWTKSKEAVYDSFIAYKLSEGVRFSEAKGQWNKLSEKQQTDYFDVNNVWETHDKASDLMNQYFDMFDKERIEHPDFTRDQIWQIVDDHVKAGVTEQRKPMKPTTGPPLGADAGSGIARHWPPAETGQQNRKILEKFRWANPFKIIKDGLQRVMQGEAITVGKSRNKAKYSQDELVRGARTLIGKPLLHNHLESVREAEWYLKGIRSDGSRFDPSSIPPLVQANIQAMIDRGNIENGKVLDAEEEDGAVEYQAAITTQEAIAMADAGLIIGPSIGAVPRNQDLKDPRGIVFTDLSIITPPEMPGDPDATAKLMEKLREMFRPTSVVLREQYRVVLGQQRRRILEEMSSRIDAAKRLSILDHGEPNP